MLSMFQRWRARSKVALGPSSPRFWRELVLLAVVGLALHWALLLYLVFGAGPK